MRDDTWLLSRLNEIWDAHFADITQVNPVTIAFGRRAKYRFGSVRLEKFGGLGTRKQCSVITITGLFRKPAVPQAVVDYTIAHELAHYVHGFSSPHKRQFKQPHKGGVVHTELKKRGLSHLVIVYKKWLKEYRKSILADNLN